MSLITQALVPLLNELPRAFFDLTPIERRRELEKRFPGGAERVLVSAFFATGTYAEISARLYGYARACGPVNLVLVQSAQAMADEERARMHRELSKRYPMSFIRFQVLPDLVGGLRVFAQGSVSDYSWNGRLRSLISSVREYVYA